MKQKLLVIIGPTASKKTTLAHKIALAINGSIINADAFQVYRQINAGVNKPSLLARKEVDYYLIDILDAHETYDIAKFAKDVDKSVAEIVQKNKKPILAGGSHLYIHAIINGYNLTSRTIRDDQEFEEYSNEELYEIVKKYNSSIALSIGMNNRKRLLRYASFAKNNVNQHDLNVESKYDTLVIMTNMKRSLLYDNINQRFNDFITNLPWIDEVNEMLKLDLSLLDSNAFKAIGYREIGNYIIKNEPINLELIRQKTRNLAKMQMTWCNNKFDQKIIFNYYEDDFFILLNLIKKWYNQ